MELIKYNHCYYGWYLVSYHICCYNLYNYSCEFCCLCCFYCYYNISSFTAATSITPSAATATSSSVVAAEHYQVHCWHCLNQYIHCNYNRATSDWYMFRYVFLPQSVFVVVCLFGAATVTLEKLIYYSNNTRLQLLSLRFKVGDIASVAVRS